MIQKPLLIKQVPGIKGLVLTVESLLYQVMEIEEWKEEKILLGYVPVIDKIKNK
jgi:hypothetical protein